MCELVSRMSQLLLSNSQNSPPYVVLRIGFIFFTNFYVFLQNPHVPAGLVFKVWVHRVFVKNTSYVVGYSAAPLTSLQAGAVGVAD